MAGGYPTAYRSGAMAVSAPWTPSVPGVHIPTIPSPADVARSAGRRIGAAVRSPVFPRIFWPMMAGALAWNAANALFGKDHGYRVPWDFSGWTVMQSCGARPDERLGLAYSNCSFNKVESWFNIMPAGNYTDVSTFAFFEGFPGWWLAKWYHRDSASDPDAKSPAFTSAGFKVPALPVSPRWRSKGPLPWAHVGEVPAVGAPTAGIETFYPALDPFVATLPGVVYPPWVRPLPLPWPIVPERPIEAPGTFPKPIEAPTVGPAPAPPPDVIAPDDTKFFAPPVVLPSFAEQTAPRSHAIAATAPRNPPKGMFTSAGYRAVRSAVNQITEYSDMIDALYWALPEDIRSEAFHEAGGFLSLNAKTRLVTQHWHEIDVPTAVSNLVKNQVIDIVYGAAGQAFKTGTQSLAAAGLWWSPFGIQSLVSIIGKGEFYGGSLNTE